MSTKDSLLIALKNSPEDTGRYTILANLFFVTYMENPQEALNYSNDMIVLSEKIGFKSGAAIGYSYAGYCEEVLGNSRKALKDYFLAIPIFKELDSLTDEAILYNNIALIYTDLGEIDLAVKYNFRSLGIKMELGDTQRIATTISNIGILYQRQDNLKRALQCYVKALTLYKAINLEAGVANCIRQIGVVFSGQRQFKEAIAFYSFALNFEKKQKDKSVMSNLYNLLGDAYQMQGDNKSAIHFYRQGLKISEELGAKTDFGEALVDVGYVYYTEGKWDEALGFYKKALAILNKSENKEDLSIVNYRMGEIYFALGKDELALIHLETSYLLANELGYPKRIRNSAELLYKLYKKKGLFEKSLVVYEAYITMKDSMEHDEGRKLVHLQKQKFEEDFEEFVQQQARQKELDKKNAQIARRNVLQYMGIFLFILISFGLSISFDFLKLSPIVSKVFIFVSLLIFFEFLLVLSDPFTDRITNGVPIYKLLVNTVLATMIFPIHSFLEKRLRRRTEKLNKT